MATSPISESLDAAFQVAVASFAAGLTDKQRRQFQGCTLKEVENTIRGVEARLASQRQQRNMQMVSKFLEGMDQLGKVIEVFVNCDSTVAFIWGPIKFILLTIGTWVETLDCLLGTYVEIGEFLPSLSEYGNLLAKYPKLGIHLHRYYCDVLEFHQNALAVFSRPSWKTAFYSAWRNFKTQFGPILSKLKRHRDLLSQEKLTVVITDVHQSSQAVEDKVDTLSRQLQHLYIDDQGLSRRYREDLNQKRELVLHKLDPPDYHYNLEKASNERHNSTSGNWLLADTAFGQWADVTTMRLRALFLNGIPGSGKTIVTARVVQHLKQLQASGQANGSSFSLLYFFFNHHQPDKRTFVAMLLSFMSQMLFQDEVLIDLVYQRCIRADQQKIRSAALLRELVELALQAQRRCFVVVDGLDECDEDQPGKPQAAQGKIIDWLESLHRQEADSEPNDRYIRLLISGQRNGVLDERLKHWPAIQLDSSRSHMDDIKTYCEVESLQLREEFNGVENLENIRLDIIRKVTSRAKGMFLYAKVVLSNLLDQPTLGDFEREIEEENFPQGMDEAYERVAVNILENRVEKRFGVARHILNLVICAERPLRWKEIQSHFSIEVQSGTANPKLRLLKPGKQFCGSLIEVSRKGVPSPQGPGPDDVLELVHETARKYLLQTAKFHFHLADLHAEMALFCAQYLCSRPFHPDTSKPDVKTHCMAGYYGFLDYAAAYWWKHGRLVSGCGDNAVLEAVANLAEALSLQHDRTVVQTQIRQLSDDGRHWEQTFPIWNRIEPIRNHLEELLGPSSTEAPADLNKLRELYGLLTYKCPKPWCLFFLDGLDTASNRDDHVRQHELPFRCDTEGCYRLQIGFARESDLVRHKKRLHSKTVSVDFAPIRRGNIFKAAAQGQLKIVQDLVAYGASVNVKDKSGSTPLFLAARARNIEVCRWLLEHGAEVDDQSTEEGLTALHAAVANDDVEVVTLLIADHGADIHVRTSTGKSIPTLVEENGCLSIRKAFPPEFWKYELPAPHDPLAFGDFDPGRVPNHLKKVKGDWSAVFNQTAPRVLDVDLLHTFEHESVVWCVKFSHDGKYLATGCNRSAFIYDVALGEKISVLQDENIDLAGDLYIRDVCFSPDSKYLVTCGEDRLIKVWDLQTNQIKATFAGHEHGIYSIDFANDGNTIASSSDRTVRTWDLETGTASLVLTIEDAITSVAISPDTRLLAASSLDRTVRIWDIKLGYLLYHFKGHLDSTYGVAFSPNSCQLLSASSDKDVKMWKLDTSSPIIGTNPAPYVKNGHCIKTFKGHLDFAASVTMTPDSEWVLSGSKDCSVHFWDPWTGQMQLRLSGHKNTVVSVASSPAATWAGGLFATASSDSRVRIWSYTRLERTES